MGILCCGILLQAQTATIRGSVTDAGTDSVEIRERVDPGSYIRRAGEDVIIGDVVVRAGMLLSSRQLAVIAAVGKGHVVVYPRPRIAVLSTGSELVEPGTPLSKGMISDSNSFLLVSAANEAGAQAYRVPPVPDDAEAFSAAISDQLHRADLILTSGGVSMGDYDYVKAVLDRIGDMRWMQVAIKPPKPLAFGLVDGTLEVDDADLGLSVDGVGGTSEDHRGQRKNDDTAKAHESFLSGPA